MLWCRQSLPPGILVFTSTPTSPWGPKSPTPSERVLQHCARYVACDGLSLSTPCWLIRTLVITELDQCNSVLVGTSVYMQDRLQSVVNAAARLVYSSRTSEHTTPLLRQLHWLRVPERIQFRLCVLAYHCLQGTAPAYLPDSLRPTSEIFARRCLRSADITTLQVPSTRRAIPLATAPFRWLQRGHGRVCHQKPLLVELAAQKTQENLRPIQPTVQILCQRCAPSDVNLGRKPKQQKLSCIYWN